MLIATIIAEIAFWVCLILGCLLRYVAKLPKLGLGLLAATPIIDLVLLVFFYITLSDDGTSDFMHGFSAFYVAFSVVFGRDIINFVDSKVERRANIRVSDDDQNFKKCLLACLLAIIILVLGIVVVGLSGSFWLVYWQISVVFTPLMWKIVEIYYRKVKVVNQRKWQFLLARE